MPLEVSLHRKCGALSQTVEGVWLAREGDILTLTVLAAGPVSARLAGADLELLSVSETPGGWASRFRLAIHTWAGRARLRISYQDICRDEALDIEPHPGKLGLQAFQEMLEELSRVSKDLPWGLSPGSAAAERDSSSPPIIHPAILEVELPILLAALRQMRSDPLLWTERHRTLAPLAAGRRLDPASCRWLLTHPATLAAVRSPQAYDAAPDPEALVEQGQIRISLDHPATRYLCYLLGRLSRVLRSTKEKLESVASGHSEGWRDPAAQARATELAQIVVVALEQISLCLRTYPFNDVQPGPPSPAAMQATVDHPFYARVQRTAHRLLDPGLHFYTEGALEASLRPTYDLFELLVLYRLGELLSCELKEPWTCTRVMLERTCLLEGPPDGEFWHASGPDELRLELRYQQKFTAYGGGPSDHGFQSISSERRPDYVLGLRRGTRLLSWCVLDAKYRASRKAIHEGLADLHVYRDALRWDGQPPWGGFILVPACQDDARGYFTTDYRAMYRFGGLCVAEPGWGKSLLQWIHEHLSAAEKVPV